MFTPAASAAGSLSRIAAHARPGLRRDVQERERGTSTRRRRRRSGSTPCPPRRSRAAARPGGPRGRASLVRPVKPPPPFGKLIASSTTFTAPAAMSVIRARYRPREPQRRQPDQHADRARDRAGERGARPGRRGRCAKSRRVAVHTPIDEQRDLAERDQPDPSVQDPEAECDDRVDRDARERRVQSAPIVRAGRRARSRGRPRWRRRARSAPRSTRERSARRGGRVLAR